MEQKQAAVQDESNLVALPEITNERSMWGLMRNQADVLVKSGMLPSSVKSAEAAMAIMQTGREFGLQPMQSFRVIHIIEGKPTLSAQFMAALVNRHCAKVGGYLRQLELTDQRCVIEYKRPEWPAPQTFSFSLDDAKRAGLAGKGNWSRHPREMMYNRAVSNACRMGWPELVAGVYDPDELEAPTYSVQQVESAFESLDPATFAPSPADERDRANARYFAVISANSPIPDFLRSIAAAKDGTELNNITTQMQAIGVWDASVTRAVTSRRHELGLPAPGGKARTVNDIAGEPEQTNLLPGDPGDDRFTN